MEQAGFEAPGSPPEQLQEEQGRSEHSLKARVGAAVAVAASVAVFAVAGIRGAKEINESEPANSGAENIEGVYTPAGEFDDTHPTSRSAEKSMVSQYFSIGHETGLLVPDADTRRFYRNTFSNYQVGISQQIPALREVAYMQDEKLFKPEYENYVNIYPVSILNNTDHPVDLMFINYAIRAEKAWLNSERADSDGFVVGGHTRASVEPNGVPHRFVMTSKIPPELHKDLPESDGVTTYFSDSTSSFIKDSGTHKYPFTPWIVGTEICQALIDVDSEKIVPGHEQEQKDVQKFVASFNESARDNMDLATQEIVCNALGREVAAAYFGGRKAVSELPSDEDEVGPTGTPWLDYEPFSPSVGKFIEIARNIRNGGSTSLVIGMKGAISPTADFYRQNEDIVSGNNR
ncbi:MAG TPA: hypothetical protein VFK11_04640 [Candidatus Saccharimonadales bacterium]|nr:hypothetical protein [Candidatus Saccharimonadales bacterium]